MQNLWFSSVLLTQGWAGQTRIRMEGGRICAIDPGVAPAADDERHGIGLPGMPNVHSHAFQRALAGLTSRRGSSTDSFWTWRETMYRFVERIGPDEIEAIAAQAYVEMLEAGFTRVGEFHYLHHAADGAGYSSPAETSARVLSAAHDAGIGMTLLPVFYAHSGFGGAPTKPAQRRFVCDLQAFARLLEDAMRLADPIEGATVGVAPHSLRAVTPDELTALIGLAAGRPLHVHIAEQAAEVAACVAWSKQRPVEWLLGHAPVDSHWCLVHATHMNVRETHGVAGSGAVTGLCPITEADLGDGFFPAVDYLATNGRFGIGSDSNVLIDVAQELRWLEYGQRLIHQSRNVFAEAGQKSTGRMMFESACAGGAQALGVSHPGLQIGAPADVVSLNADHVILASRSGDELLDSWIFGARNGLIDCVWRGGRLLVKDGRHVDRDAVASRYARALQRLLM